MNLIKASVRDRIEYLRSLSHKVWGNAKAQADLAICQAILESDITGTPSFLATEGKNLFGIKAEGTLGYIKLRTLEYIDGKWIKTYAKFGKNRTYTESFKQHYDLMHRPRYATVLSATALEQAAINVWRCGYATDPRYPKKLIAIYTSLLA